MGGSVGPSAETWTFLGPVRHRRIAVVRTLSPNWRDSPDTLSGSGPRGGSAAAIDEEQRLHERVVNRCPVTPKTPNPSLGPSQACETVTHTASER